MTSMTKTAPHAMRAAFLGLALSLASVPLAVPGVAQAQGLFDPMVKVDGAAITRYELDQRAKLLKLLRAPADPARLAREQLIEDRLGGRA